MEYLNEKRKLFTYEWCAEGVEHQKDIRNAKGTLTEEDISSDLCLNLFIGRVPIGVSDVPNGTFHSEYRFLKIESQRKLTVP